MTCGSAAKREIPAGYDHDPEPPRVHRYRPHVQDQLLAAFVLTWVRPLRELTSPDPRLLPVRPRDGSTARAGLDPLGPWVSAGAMLGVERDVQDGAEKVLQSYRLVERL